MPESRLEVDELRHPAAAVSRPRVLVVEDVETTRRRIAAVLRSRGYRVEEAANGAQGMRQLTTSKFDAILLDLVMPNVDGWQFRQAQLQHPELAAIPTIVVSAKPLSEVERYTLKASGFIRKPFEDDALVSTVANACAARPAAHVPAPTEQDGKALFWSKRGEIACAAHSPINDSERWLSEKWTAIPGGNSHKRILYQCQHCSGRGPIHHRTRAHEQ